MAAGLITNPWRHVPVCILRHDGKGKAQSVAHLDAFATAQPISQEWVVRYVKWWHYPPPGTSWTCCAAL